jgi:hypothetical protein
VALDFVRIMSLQGLRKCRLISDLEDEPGALPPFVEKRDKGAGKQRLGGAG